MRTFLLAMIFSFASDIAERIAETYIFRARDKSQKLDTARIDEERGEVNDINDISSLVIAAPVASFSRGKNSRKHLFFSAPSASASAYGRDDYYRCIIVDDI